MFSTLTDTLIKPAYHIHVRNLEVNLNHWRSIKHIDRLISELELILIRTKSFDNRDFLQWLLALNSLNTRIEEFKFYVDKTYPQTLVCVCISNLTTFKPQNFLERNIIVNFKKQNKVLFLTDITIDEWNDRDKKIYRQWEYLEQLSAEFNKYKKLFLV